MFFLNHADSTTSLSSTSEAENNDEGYEAQLDDSFNQLPSRSDTPPQEETAKDQQAHEQQQNEEKNQDFSFAPSIAQSHPVTQEEEIERGHNHFSSTSVAHTEKAERTRGREHHKDLAIKIVRFADELETPLTEVSISPSSRTTVSRGEEHFIIPMGDELLTPSMVSTSADLDTEGDLSRVDSVATILEMDDVSIDSQYPLQDDDDQEKEETNDTTVVHSQPGGENNTVASLENKTNSHHAPLKRQSSMKRVKSKFDLTDDILLPSDELSKREDEYHRLKAGLLYRKQEKELRKASNLSIDPKNEQTDGNWFQQTKKSVKRVIKRAKRFCVGAPPKKIYDLDVQDAKLVKTVIIDLLYALLSFGMPVYRVENHCHQICTCYGVNCYLDATNSGFLITFANSFDEEYTDTRFIKIPSTYIDLSKLCLLDDVAYDIISNRVSIHDAKQRIKDIISKPPLYASFVFTIFSYTLSSTCFSIFIYSLWHEIIAAVVVGFLVGVCTVIVRKFFPSLLPVLPAVNALVSGLISVAFKAIYARHSMPMKSTSIALAGIITMMPGLSITTSIQELTSKQLRSGALRLVGALTTSVQLGAGIYVARVIELASTIPNIQANTFYFPKWALALVIPCSSVSYMVSLKAPQYPMVILFIIANGYQAYFLTQYMSILLTPELGSMIGAFSIQTISKIYGWLSNHPPAVITSCVILNLVPGSMSVRGINALLDNDLDNGTWLLVRTLQVALGLAIGLILANFCFAWINHRHDQVTKIHKLKRIRLPIYPDLEGIMAKVGKSA